MGQKWKKIFDNSHIMGIMLGSLISLFASYLKWTYTTMQLSSFFFETSIFCYLVIESWSSFILLSRIKRALLLLAFPRPRLRKRLAGENSEKVELDRESNMIGTR